MCGTPPPPPPFIALYITKLKRERNSTLAERFGVDDDEIVPIGGPRLANNISPNATGSCHKTAGPPRAKRNLPLLK